MRFAGKVVVVTGASQGLGRHVAQRFAREGARVMLAARSVNLLQEAAAEVARERGDAGGVLTQVCDVRDPRSVEALFQQVARTWSNVDVVLNSAGVAGPRGDADEVGWDDWKDAVEINLVGTVLVCRAAAAIMKHQGGGSIINVSGGGATKPLPGLSAYAAAKAGVVRFTETVAQEWKRWNIRVNAVAPGVLATRMVDDFLDAGSERLGAAYVSEVARQKANSLPAFERAADLCLFLASDESAGITGRLISAPWDPWSRLPQHQGELESSDVYTLRRITPEDRGFSWTKP